MKVRVPQNYGDDASSIRDDINNGNPMDMSAVHDVPTLTSPPPYTITTQNYNRPSSFKRNNIGVTNIDFSTEPILVARYCQTLNTLNFTPFECNLPEVVSEDDTPVIEIPESEGLISMESDGSGRSSTPLPESVTPLHLLSDQSDTVDCPFCCRRVVTRIKKEPSYITHITATTLLVTTFAGVVAPYKKRWSSNITHFCSNCDRRVAYQKYGKKMIPLGTPEHLKVVSKFPVASVYKLQMSPR